MEGRKAARTQYVDVAASKRWALLQKAQPASCRILSFIIRGTQLVLALTLNTGVNLDGGVMSWLGTSLT